MKDFANSYEQRRWEFSANSHARAVELRKIRSALDQRYLHATKAFDEYLQKMIDDAEAKYPQLKAA